MSRCYRINSYYKEELSLLWGILVQKQIQSGEPICHILVWRRKKAGIHSLQVTRRKGVFSCKAWLLGQLEQELALVAPCSCKVASLYLFLLCQFLEDIEWFLFQIYPYNQLCCFIPVTN